VTFPVTVVLDKQTHTQESLMTQLRLASVNLRLVSKTPTASSRSFAAPPDSSHVRSPLERKCRALALLNPRLAGVIEKLVDNMLDELEGRRP